MSAYVVDPAHVSYLIQAAISSRYGVKYGPFPNYTGNGTYDGPHPERIDTHNATRFGSDLMRENIASVMHRYPDDSYDTLPGPIETATAIDYVYRHSSSLSLRPVDVLKAIDGYVYQSCEHPEWETSDAKAFCDRLRSEMIGRIDGYDDSAYWSVTAEMAHPVRNAIRPLRTVAATNSAPLTVVSSAPVATLEPEQAPAPEVDRFDIDRTGVLNGYHWRQCEYASRDREELPANRCIGCWSIIEDAPRFCPTCGAPLHADDTIERILRAPFPAVVNPDERRKGRKEIAADIRALLKQLKIKGISVTAPSYSMASSVHIKMPNDKHIEEGSTGWDHEYRTCPRCQRRNVADKRLESLILAAFPDLNDRSDSMSDYYDYILSIN